MRLIKKFIKKLYHLIWFLSAFLLFSPRVNAAVNIDGANFVQASEVSFADNTNGYLTSVGSTWVEYGSYWRSGSSILTTGGNYGANVAFLSDVPFVQGHTYSVSFLIGLANGYAVTNYNSNSRICIAENIYNVFARYNQPGSFPCTTGWSSSTNTSYYFSDGQVAYQYAMLSFVFTAEFTSNVITFTYNSSISNESNHSFGGYIVEEISSQPLTQSQIQSAIQSSGLATANSVSQVQQSINQMQTDINTSSQNIINNNNNNTTNIINNQNENTDKEIESQKVCKDIDKNNIIDDNKILNSSGVLANGTGDGVTGYINISKGSLELLTQTSSINAYMCFYNTNKSIVGSCISTKNASLGPITIPTGATYFRATIVKSENKPTFRVCQDGNQALNDSIGNLNDNITNDEAPDIDLDLDVSSDTPISDLITMPLTILNSLINTLSDTCSNYTLPFFFNNTITLPCFTISDYLGSNVTNYIDLFICLYMCYEIGMLVVSIFEDITSLRDIYDSLYVPKHAYTGYQPRHAKGGTD